MSKEEENERQELPLDNGNKSGNATWPKGKEASQPRFQFNQQINLFGDIVGFKELEDVSPEIQKAALEYLHREQVARHQWVGREQTQKHAADKINSENENRLLAWGQLLGVAVFLAILGFAGWMFTIGQGAVGVATIIGEAAAAVGLVIWAKNEKRRNSSKPENSRDNQRNS